MNKKNIVQNNNKKGSAVLIVLLMLIFIFTATLGIAEIFFKAINIGTLQTSSVKAYFSAESGIEKTLWEYKKNGFNMDSATSTEGVFSDNFSNGSSYIVNYATSSDASFNYQEFTSTGSYKDVKRSVEISLKFPKL